MNSNKFYDFVVIGTGIVGLTTAYELLKRRPHVKIAFIEKEPVPGMHASGRNSGVVHCGIYYDSSTLKAQVCSQGARKMIEFARSEGIAYQQNGKLILAINQEQLATVDKLMINAAESGIKAERITKNKINLIEPYAAKGEEAIFCAETAVIDNLLIIQRLHQKLERLGVEFIFNCKVNSIDSDNKIETDQGIINYGFLINCAGAYADLIAKMLGIGCQYALIPFKGIYWKLNKSEYSKVKSNIYPVPDISMPFLGVHLTKTITGDVYAGPTAIPALGRENYGLIKGMEPLESFEVAKELAVLYWKNDGNFRKSANLELAKYNKGYFYNAVRKLVPSIAIDDLVHTPKVGIRPQLVNKVTNKLEMDYILLRGQSSIHVLNAISPAFTSSFSFAELIVNQII